MQAHLQWVERRQRRRYLWADVIGLTSLFIMVGVVVWCVWRY